MFFFENATTAIIKPVGTGENLEDLETVIGADSNNASPEGYVIYRSAHGVMQVLRDHAARLFHKPKP